jgi:hypothetical protein
VVQAEYYIAPNCQTDSPGMYPEDHKNSVAALSGVDNSDPSVDSLVSEKAGEAVESA